MSVFDDVGGWIEDQVSIPNLLRLAASATVFGAGVGAIADIIRYLPGPAQRAAEAFIVALPSVVEGKDLQTALIAEYAYQAKRAATSYATAAAAGVAAPYAAKANALVAKAKDLGIQIPPEVTASAASAQGYLASVPGQAFSSKIAADWFTKTAESVLKSPAVRSAVTDAKRWAAEAGTDLYRALERFGSAPEQASRSIKGRPDAAVVAINALAGQHLYDIDWYDPVSGEPITDPVRLKELFAVARHRLASPEVLGELRRRYLRAAGLPSEIAAPVRFRDRSLGALSRQCKAYIPEPAQLTTAADAHITFVAIEHCYGAETAAPFRARYASLLLDEDRAIEERERACRASGTCGPVEVAAPGMTLEGGGSSPRARFLRELLVASVLTAPAWIVLLVLPALRGRGRKAGRSSSRTRARGASRGRRRTA